MSESETAAVPRDLVTAVRVTFPGRIGRTATPPIQHPPLDIAEGDPDIIAAAVREYAWGFLQSEDVYVDVDLDEMRGTIFCGAQIAGKFLIEHTSEEVWL